MKRRDLALFVLLCAIWGLSFVALKVALRYADPIFLASLRFWIPAFLVGAWTAWRGRPVQPAPRDIPMLAVLGVLNTGLLAMLLTLGQVRISAGLASILLYTYPLMAAVVAALFLSERIDGLKAGGLGLGFAGIVLITGFGGHGSAVGIVLVLGAAASWAAGTVVFKRIIGRHDVFMLTAWQLGFGAAFLSLASLIAEGAPRIEFNGALVVSFLWMTIPGMAVAGTLWFWLLERGEAAVASAYMFMTPVFGVFFGWAILDEEITAATVAGGALVAVAIYLVNRRAAAGEGREDQRPSRRVAFPTTMRSRASSDMGSSANSENQRSSEMKG